MTTHKKVAYAVSQFETWYKMVTDDSFRYMCPTKKKDGSCVDCDDYDLKWITEELEHLLKLLKDDKDNNNQPPST